MNVFDKQWCHVIGIPRDLFSKTAVKVQPFSFFINSKKYDMSFYQILNTKPRYMRVFAVHVAFLEEDEKVKFFR